MVVEVVGEAVVWTRWRWRRRGVEAHAEEEWALGMNPTAVDDSLV
jgi:hypothetical protein